VTGPGTAVQAAGLSSEAASADGPLLICYDGSEHAKHAIKGAARLLAHRPALVVTVWQPTAALDGLGWFGETASIVDFISLDRAGAEAGGRVASEGVRIAQEAGLDAEPVAIKATGPVWQTIIEIAERHDAAALVMGSRGLAAVRSMLLGSVSSAVVQHADRPTVVIHRPSDEQAA
jgi:nucleotide-binding universal stress UspA family protein